MLTGIARSVNHLESGYNKNLKKTIVAFGLLLKASLFSLAFIIFGIVLAPLVFWGLMLGKFPG